jgi:hypothetical protein
MLRKSIFGLALVCLILLSPLAMASGLNLQTRSALDRNLPQMNFTGVALKDAIDFLRDVSGLNIHVNWKALEVAGVAADTPINVKLRDVSIRKVLTLVLNEASGGVGLTFYADDGVVEITTREIADAQMFTVVYPVQDLLFEPPLFTDPPDFALSANGIGGANRVRGGGAAAGQVKDKDAKAEELITLITETVYPECWVQNGGKDSIKFFSGNLIVTASRSVHEAIGGIVD